MNVEICITEKNRSITISKDELQELIKAIQPSARMFANLHTTYPENESIAKFNNTFADMLCKLIAEERKKIELPYLSFFNLASSYNGFAADVVSQTRKKGIEAEKDVYCIKLNELHKKLNSFFL